MSIARRPPPRQLVSEDAVAAPQHEIGRRADAYRTPDGRGLVVEGEGPWRDAQAQDGGRVRRRSSRCARVKLAQVPG